MNYPHRSGNLETSPSNKMKIKSVRKNVHKTKKDERTQVKLNQPNSIKKDHSKD